MSFMSGKTEIIVSPRSAIAGKVTLYKYISVKGLEGLIRNGSFKVTYRTNCNDPQEMTPAGRVGDFSMYDYRGFLSFTKNGNNSPRWGNYADSYTGACIEFEFDYFSDSNIRESEPEEKLLLERVCDLRKMGFEVKFFNAFFDGTKYVPSGQSRLLIDCIYSREHRRVEWPHGSETWEGAKRNAEYFAWAIMCTKDKAWEYEDEVRMPIYRSRDILNPDEEDKRETALVLTKVPTKYIKRIILGPLSKYTEESVRNAISRNRKQQEEMDTYIPSDAEVVKAQFSKYSYELNYTGQEEDDNRCY